MDFRALRNNQIPEDHLKNHKKPFQDYPVNLKEIKKPESNLPHTFGTAERFGEPSLSYRAGGKVAKLSAIDYHDNLFTVDQ